MFVLSEDLDINVIFLPGLLPLGHALPNNQMSQLFCWLYLGCSLLKDMMKFLK